MTLEELFSLRREVRRNDDVSDKAARLFAEIVDLHQLGAGCIAQDVKLAEYIGCHPRTVARRRNELAEAGYLRVDRSAERRKLVPKWPEDPDEQGKTVPDRFVESPDRTVETPDTGVKRAPDTSVTHREINIPAEPGESGRAHEAAGEEERIDQLLDIRNGDIPRSKVRDVDRWRVKMYQLAHPDYDPSVLVVSEWREKITDPVAWARAIIKGLKRRWQPVSVDAREDAYEEFAEEEGTTAMNPRANKDTSII
jgi:hypothetical protein